MSPYFQVGQHLKSVFVLDAITTFLMALPQQFTFSCLTPPVAVGKVDNKTTEVRVLSINNVDTLHDYLAFFLLALPFQTRKRVDFYL